MRPYALALTLLALPAPLWADDISVSSDVTQATIFPQGASLTRVAQVDVPEGRHQIILTDMPMIDPATLQLSAPGLTLGAIRYRDDFVPPRTQEDQAQIAAAKAEVEVKEQALQAAQDAVAAIRAEAEAARSRIAFLDGIGQSDGLAQASPDQLRALVDLIGVEGLQARQAVQQAEIRMRPAQRAVKEAEEELSDAKAALAALETEDEDRAYLVIDVQAAAATTADLTLSYITNAASWEPTYDLRLFTGDTDSLSMDRGAYVRQSTGENWSDVQLTLSTVRPSGQQEPGEVWPWLRRIFDPESMPQPVPMATRSLKARDGEADMMLAEPVMEEVAPSASFDGIAVTYDYPDAVSIANEADAVRLGLGSVEFEPEVFARAVPLSDSTAFVSAEITNNSGELILGTGDARFYLNGTFVGQRYLDLIAEGDEAELSFGPIEGLRLERIVRDRQEGDRGVIARSNEQNETVDITLRNLTDRAWDVRLRDRVPYSEQEDLSVTYDATPAPIDTNVDGRRGVLEWRFTMDAGTEEVVTLSHKLRWPQGQQLR
ncbi:mucoidy inhibitor MuiA family protein [Pseudooceanicola sp. MF1-13]|uniref:mucoidy inhibitor MuiA family protein n=1 Tax=Pseudooceanicola sp. MF1-13 TaxID=3379095 RepID=UPI0038916C93